MFGGQDKPKGAKQSLDVEKGRERRHNHSISIRKGKRDELLDKKRRMGTQEDGTDYYESTVENPLDPYAYDSKTNPAVIPLELLPQFAEMSKSSDPQQAFHGTLMIRKLLSVESNPPIDAVVNEGVVPVFVTYMGYDAYPRLQFEAAWALTNIASGTNQHTRLIIEQGAVPLFIHLLSSPDEDCREQATWALGNLAGDGASCRDYVLELGVMPPLINLINSPNKITVTRNAVWAMSNLCRSKPQPKLELVAVALPTLAALLNHHDEEVVVDATWAISYISDGSNERIQAVIEAQVVNRIVQLLSAPTAAMQTPAIRTIGNIATGSDRQTQMIINSGALQPMHFLLGHSKRAIRKETCWTLSNICAGSRDQIQAVINANLFPVILEKGFKSTELEVKKEAVWCVANTASGGTKEQIRYLVVIGAIPALCELLVIFDPKIIAVALEALGSILDLGEEDKQSSPTGRNAFADIVQECGGVELIEKLQAHNNHEVYQNAMQILETYFELEDNTGTVAATIPHSQSGFQFQQDGSAGNGAANFLF